MAGSNLSMHKENIRKIWNFYLECAEPYSQLAKEIVLKVRYDRGEVRVNLEFMMERDHDIAYKIQSATYQNFGKLQEDIAPSKLK